MHSTEGTGLSGWSYSTRCWTEFRCHCWWLVCDAWKMTSCFHWLSCGHTLATDWQNTASLGKDLRLHWFVKATCLPHISSTSAEMLQTAMIPQLVPQLSFTVSKLHSVHTDLISRRWSSVLSRAKPALKCVSLFTSPETQLLSPEWKKIRQQAQITPALLSSDIQIFKIPGPKKSGLLLLYSTAYFFIPNFILICCRVCQAFCFPPDKHSGEHNVLGKGNKQQY